MEGIDGGEHLHRDIIAWLVALLPTLRLPAVLIRIWPLSDKAPGQDVPGQAFAELTAVPGFLALDENLVAVLPFGGRTSVFDLAVYWSRTLRRRLAEGEHTATSILIFPGEVVLGSGEPRAIQEHLLQDLEIRRPEPMSDGIFVSGYAANRLRGRFQIEPAVPYLGPSGRRVPIFRLTGERSDPMPWHNPEILGRRVAIDRPTTRERLRQAAGDPRGFLVHGALGIGKSHAVWHFLAERREPTIWIDVGRALPGTSILARRLAAGTAELDDGATIAKDLDGDPEIAVEALTRGLRQVADRLGARPRVVCDGVQAITAEDRDLLCRLVAEPRSAETCRWVLIRRTGGEEHTDLARLAKVEVPAMSTEELDEFQSRLFAGLEMSEEMTAAFTGVAAGNPFVLEEILLELAHSGLVRRVYGSYFFDGGTDVVYEPSPYWIGQVEAEARRLGEPLPLRLLAASRLIVPTDHLALAAAELDVELADGWQRPYLEAGWLTESPSTWGPGLRFAGPAYEKALRGTLVEDATVALRRTLGQILAAKSQSPAGDWHTYRLLAGTPEALTPLLDFSRSGVEHPTRGELFEALQEELREHRQRGGNDAAELEILWNLLPLGRRLDRLRELGPELERALELSVDKPRRLVAFATLQAELDQQQGRYREAERRLRQALAASSEGVDDKRRAAILARLGEILIREQRLEEAQELFEDLLAVVESVDPATSATCHFHLGNIALHRKNPQTALDHHRKAYRIRRDSKLWKTLGASLTALGSVRLTLGDFPRALSHYREAEEVLSKHGSAAELTLARRGIGRALGVLGDYLAAIQQLRKALAERRGRDLISEAAVRLDLAANQLELGNVELALEDARQAHFQLSLAPESGWLGDAEQVLGRVLARQDQDAAGEHLVEARRLHLRHQDPEAAAVDVSLLLGLALERGDMEAILSRFSELETLLESPHPTFDELLSFRLYLAAEWLHQQGPAPESPPVPAAPETYLRRAFQDLVRKTDFLTPDLRHGFLFQIREHRELVNAATRYNLTFPGM